MDMMFGCEKCGHVFGPATKKARALGPLGKVGVALVLVALVWFALGQVYIRTIHKWRIQGIEIKNSRDWRVWSGGKDWVLAAEKINPGMPFLPGLIFRSTTARLETPVVLFAAAESLDPSVPASWQQLLETAVYPRDLLDASSSSAVRTLDDRTSRSHSSLTPFIEAKSHWTKGKPGNVRIVGCSTIPPRDVVAFIIVSERTHPDLQRYLSICDSLIAKQPAVEKGE